MTSVRAPSSSETEDAQGPRPKLTELDKYEHPVVVLGRSPASAATGRHVSGGVDGSSAHTSYVLWL